MTKPNEPGRRHWADAGPLATVRRELEALVGGLLDREKPSSERSALTPLVDVSETDEAVEVTADVPGMKADEVEIDLEADRLIIAGEHLERRATHERTRVFHRAERRRGRFRRVIPLPCPVQPEGAEAEVRDGVLHVRLPKEKGSQRRQIPIRGEEGNEF